MSDTPIVKDFSTAKPGELGSLELLTEDQRRRLADLLDDFVVAIGRGEMPNVEAIASRNPDLAAPFLEFAPSMAELHRQFASREKPFPERVGQEDPGTPVAMPVTTEPVGTLGDYELVREVGKGGMGVVYEARQKSLGRKVALKVLPFAAVLDQRQIARFQLEAQAAALLQHPRIVPVYGVGREQGVYFYSMQYVEGQSLAEIIDAWGRSRGSPGHGTVRATGVHGVSGQERFRVVAKLMASVAEAVQYAHDSGVLHRDLKPSNLLVDRDGNPWVTDFGLARIRTEGRLTTSGEWLGTLRYLSPEQATKAGSGADELADVYGLGVTLYELLTLRPAFDGPVDATLVRRIADEEPVRARCIDPDIPTDLETIASKAMAKDRGSRYSSAAALARDLELFLARKPILARRATIPDRLWKLLLRHPRIALAAAAVLAVAFVGLCLANWRILLANDRTKVALIQMGEERNRATANFSEARRAVAFLGTQFATRVAELPGGEELAAESLAAELPFYQSFLRRDPGNRGLQHEEALVRVHLAALQWRLGQHTLAEQNLEAGGQTVTRLLLEAPNDEDLVGLLATCSRHTGDSRYDRFDLAGAEKAFLAVVDLLEQRFTDARPYQGWRRELAAAHYGLGQVQESRGQASVARDHYRLAMAQVFEIMRSENYPPEVPRDYALYQSRYALLTDLAMDAEVERTRQQSVDAITAYGQEFPRKLSIQSAWASCLSHQAKSWMKHDSPSRALDSARLATDKSREVFRLAPTVVPYRVAFAENLADLAEKLLRQGQLDDARKLVDEATIVCLETENNPHAPSRLLCARGRVLATLGWIWLRQGLKEDAMAAAGRATQFHEALHKRFPEVVDFTEFLDRDYQLRAKLCFDSSDWQGCVQGHQSRRSLWEDSPRRFVSIAVDLATEASQLPGDSPGRTALRAAAIQLLKDARTAGYSLTPIELGQPALQELDVQ